MRSRTASAIVGSSKGPEAGLPLPSGWMVVGPGFARGGRAASGSEAQALGVTRVPAVCGQIGLRRMRIPIGSSRVVNRLERRL